MGQTFIVVALAAAGVYLVRRALFPGTIRRGIDVGAVSDGWIAEHRREEPR